MTRVTYLIPNDRTLTRKQWKVLDGLFRQMDRVSRPIVDQAYTDALIYGRGTINTADYTQALNADMERIAKRKARG